MATEFSLIPDTRRTVIEIVASSKCAQPLTDEEVLWAADTILPLLNTNPDLAYRNLALIDRRGWIGRIALTYALKFTQAVHGFDSVSLQELWAAAPFPELDLNPYLSEAQVVYVSEKLQAATMIMNHLLVSGRTSGGNGEDTRTQCMREVCVQLTGEDTPFMQATENFSVWVPTPEGTGQCFPLLELITLLIVGSPNPLTGIPFSQRVVNFVQRVYPIETEMVRYYLTSSGIIVPATDTV